MALEEHKTYRLFCKASAKNNVTVVSGGNVVGTKLHIQPYYVNSTWQYVHTGTFYKDPNDTRDVYCSELNFQCNWIGEQEHGDLHPAITNKATKIDGEQVKLNTTDFDVYIFNRRTIIKYVPANKKVTINGCEYDGYYLEFSNGKVLDARDTYLSVYDNAGIDSQIFAFVPDRALQNSIAPTCTMSNKDIMLNSTYMSTVSISSGVDCQARIRKATLNHNSSTFSDYGDYFSPNGSKQDDGFESGWGKNTGKNFNLEIEAANSTKGIDSTKYEIEYRSITGFERHNASAFVTFTTRQKIEYSIGEALISADGLKLSWSSNAYREEGTTSVKLYDVTEDGALVCKGRTKTFSSVKGGVIEIPFSELKKYPVTGSILRVRMGFTLISQYAVGGATKTKDVVVSAEGGDLNPVIDISTENGFDLTVSVSERDGASFNVCECSMIYEHNGSAIVKPLVELETHKFFAPTRINADTFIVVNIEDTTQTTTKWGVNSYTHEYDERIPTTLVINSENMEFEFKYSNEKWPGNKSDSPTYSSLHKAGKRLPDFYYETNYENKFTIDGLRFDTNDKYKLEMVLRERYLVVRNSKGYYANCAYLGKQLKEIDINTTECSLEFAEMDRDVDVALPY